MKKERPVERESIQSVPGYPSFPTGEEIGCQDPSRRRFIAQVGLSVGAAGFLSALGLPRLAHGQSMEVDFSVLDAHPELGTLAGPPVEGALPAAAATEEAASVEAAASPVLRAAAPMPAAGHGPQPAFAVTPPPAQVPLPPGPPVSQGTTVSEITEDRALWIDPGYMVLLRWARPADNLDVVAAFESSANKLNNYLAVHVTSREDLHDHDRLHTLEVTLAGLLEERIRPARILVIHLTHDCNTVCSRFGPTYDDIPLPGMIAPPMGP